ncbi:TetR/AcrR family transcriptional regulator [Virgibacillus oceani]
MTEAKLDRRKKYTRMVLKDSMIKLLKEKQISEITVKEICELADVNRSTFYAHYLDLYDLLNKMEEEVLDDMKTYLYQYNFQKDEESIQMTERILEYIVANKEIAQILLHENADPNFQKRVMKIAQKYLMDSWGLAKMLDEDFTHYLSIFTIGGCLQMIREWLEGNLDQSPKEMAILINNFANNGLSVVK